MTEQPDRAQAASLDPNEDPPEEIPRPTYAPAAMALGITFLFWGLVTSIVVFGAGVLVITASLVGWIGEIRYER